MSDLSMYPNRWFVRNITYPFLCRFLVDACGSDVLLHHRAFCESEHWPLERHREHQLRRIQGLVAHAHAHVPFYRDRLTAQGMEPGDIKSLEDFAKIPLLTRRDLQAHFDDLIAQNLPASQHAVHSTSGSTGTPLRFAVDKTRYMRVRAMMHRNHQWCGIELGDRHAYLWAAFGRSAMRSCRFRLSHWAANQVFCAAMELGDAQIEEYNALFLRHQPQLLTGFPSSLCTYARWLGNNGRSQPRLKSIIATGETLFPHQRALLTETFGCPVFNRYGSMELGDVAHECEQHAGLHCNEERTFTEIIPDPELPEGVGDIVVTDLDNMAMPLLRYRTEDLASWHEDPTGCACGRSLRRLAEVQGRRYDDILDRNGVPINGLVLEDLGAESPGIAQFQCVQVSPERLIFRVVALDGYSAAQIRENILRRSKVSIGPDRFEIDVELVDQIAPGKSGKLRQIVSEVR